VYFDPQRVKSFARIDPTIRRGVMDKSDMQDAARSETGIQQFNHNEADAYIIARSAVRFWEFFRGVLTEDELLPSEKPIFKRVHTFLKGVKAGKTVEEGLIFKENDRFFQFSKLTEQDISVE
jgi:hypothetical protein